jgi:SAM-dependent methyltransferase
MVDLGPSRELDPTSTHVLHSYHSSGSSREPRPEMTVDVMATVPQIRSVSEESLLKLIRLTRASRGRDTAVIGMGCAGPASCRRQQTRPTESGYAAARDRPVYSHCLQRRIVGDKVGPVRMRPEKSPSLFSHPRLFDWWGRAKYVLLAAPAGRMFPDLRSSFEAGVQHVAEDARPPVLDVGGGRGELGALLLTRGISAVVLEKNEVQCRLLRSKYPGLQLVRGDAHRLPFKDNAFETTIFRAVLHHARNPRAVLTEARRISRQSLVLDLVRDDRWPIGWLEALWAYVQDDKARIMTGREWRSVLDSLGCSDVQLVSARSLRYFLWFRVMWSKSPAGDPVGTSPAAPGSGHDVAL